MKRIKSVVLAMMMVVVLALPVMAGETQAATTPGIAEQVASVRADKYVAPPGYSLSLDSRIYNLTVELAIHKFNVEPDEVFKAMARETMLPEMEGRMLSAKARQFNSIASLAINGLVSDDIALLQLQMLNYRY